MNAKDFVGESWGNVLQPFFESKYMAELASKLSQVRKTKNIYPLQDDLFRAFKLTPFDDVKVVWLGMSPYIHAKEATGLAFDCSRIQGDTPSWKAISTAYTGDFPSHFSTHILDGNLEYWAEQGVLLINAALTCQAGYPESHLRQWAPFMKNIINLLNKDIRPKAFLSLGNVAKNLLMGISPPHLNLHREHPAYSARQNRAWDAQGVWKEIDRFHKWQGVEEINW